MNTQNKTEQEARVRAALRAIADGVVAVVKSAGPLGMPGGHIYAALMAHGCTLEQFEQLMSGLVKAGKLKKRGECYIAL